MKNTRRIKYFPLEGGEDLITPLYSRPPGLLVVSQNFECDPGGRYRRIAGYERYDGRPSPSEASYWVLYFDAGGTKVVAGNTVTGHTSSATGIAIIDGVLESGSYAGSDAAGYLVLREVSGTFQNNEALKVSGSSTCTANGVATSRGAPSPTLDTTYLRAAVADARDDIAAVPGSGNVLGVWMYKGTLYAFRNNAGGTATDMYKSSTAGWTKVSLPSIMDFNVGTAAFDEGLSITGGTSGATATVKRVVVTSGSWGSGNAIGYMVLGGVTGDFSIGETITSTGWDANAAAEANQWESVCWSPELEIFCAVASSGTNRVMTSTDGETWTARSAAAANEWKSVCWSPELTLFCAVAASGTDNRVMTSPNGVDWTSRDAAEENEWQSVCWSPELTLFCAVSKDGTHRVMTSPTGETWTARSATGSVWWYDVCWSPELELFAAIGVPATNAIMTSPDGINWTERTLGSLNFLCICWSPGLGLFCAVGYNGVTATSQDGITWTYHYAPNLAYEYYYGVCWSAELELFCAVGLRQGAPNQPRVCVSENGVDWDTQSLTDLAGSYRHVCWSAGLGLFCAVAYAGASRTAISDSGYQGQALVSVEDSAIALTIGGRYEFVNHNFYGHSDYYRMYGCDGKNYAFEFDGTTYVPIRTGMTTDTPTHIAAFKKHLFLSFAGGSVQHSSTGEPVEWSAITGASEIGVGQDVVSMVVTAGGTLAIYRRNGILLLTGTGSSDWVLSEYSTEIGAIEWSVQKLGSPIGLDDNGLTSLDAVTAYGDFKANSLSQNIQTFFTEAKKTAVVASMRVKAKEQYRLFFSDDTGINLTFNGSKVVGFTRLRYPDSVTCTCSGEDTNGNEVLFFGSDDGMVYELDKGTSFDGDAITAYFKTSLATLGSPENTKRFFKLVIERDNLQEEGEWGVGTWGNFYWGEQGEERDESYLDETGTGYDYLYYSSSAYLESFVMQGVIIHYSVGGLKR